MINPNLTPKEKALAAARLLRGNAFMPVDNSRTVRPGAEPGMIAADAIEQLVKENEELRAQLVAFQKAANPAVAVDPTSDQGITARHAYFTVGDRVRLKANPDHRGEIIATRSDGHLIKFCYVQFKTPFEHGHWIYAPCLELIPDK
ncbi:hypothetical protein OPZ14_001717 [Salmonella enterica subsp. enterica]|nr:hypothetical protein [Salmonella enterica subsp. enterica]EKC4148764.1 hypothetical protein [Salmonella enterica subsp. enterica]